MRIGIDASRAFGEERTGTENYSYQLITHLSKLPEASNHEWILYVKPNSQFTIHNLQSNFKFQIINLPYLWTQAGLAYQTWIDNLDVLWIPAHTLPILRKPGLKTVVTIHGIEYEYLPAYENKLQRWYLPLSTKYAVHNASKIIAVSHYTAKQIKERLGGDPAKINVVYEGFSNSQLPITNYQLILNKYNLQKHKYILFIGTVQPRKNLSRLIEAHRALKSKNLKLVIVGKLGWNYEDLPVDKDPQIKFLRYINDAERDIILQNALVYIQPSITEGFGLPILEAFAAGVPVASSTGGALSEVVGDAGLLFDPYNTDDIRHKLSLVIDSQKLQKDLIAKGKTRLEQFSWQKAAKRTYSILVDS